MRSKIIVVVFALLLAGCGQGQDAEPPTRTLALPGERVFPEGIAVDERTGDLYVGSTSDGTVFRSVGGREPFAPFLPGGRGGRTAATGLKVLDGRLYIAGRSTGRLFVYDLAARTRLRAAQIPSARRTLLNDLAFAGGAAYVTDSYADVIYRLPLSGTSERLVPWLPLEGTPIPTGAAFGLNGIVASDDGRFLFTVHFDTGRLFRVEVATRAVREVDLGGKRLATGDGLLLDGRTLLAVREEPGDVVPVRLSADGLRGELGEPLGGGELDFPTTAAERDGTLYVVNSQLDRAPDRGRPPFTVSALRLPDGLGR